MAPDARDPFRFSSRPHSSSAPLAAAWILVLAAACALFVALALRVMFG